MLLREVQLTDVDVYVRMRCDPVMMAELGGPLPREGIEPKVARDVATVESGEGLILMIVPDDDDPDTVAGQVVLWTHEEAEFADPITEIGWMVLPEFQGRGLAKAAVRLILDRARQDGFAAPIHAYAGVTNHPSNAICRAIGFELAGQQDVVAFGDRTLTSNHWVLAEYPSA